MPLHCFNRESGQISGDKRYSLELPGELAADDIECEEWGSRGLSLFDAWLYANFRQGVLWVPESQDYDEYKQRLAEFINENIKGPFYVMEGFANTRELLEIILLDPEDIQTFKKTYGDWFQDHAAADKNSVLLAKWLDTGYEFNNPTVAEYAAVPSA